MRGIAHKYAQAFLNTVGQSLSLGDVAHLQKCIEALSGIARLKTYLKLRISPAIKKEKMLQCMQPYQLPSSIVALVDLLQAHQRLFLIIDVLQAIIDQYYIKNNYLNVTVTSAQELDAEKKEIAVQFLKKMTGKKIIAHYDQDPDMIAGMRFVSNQYLWEDSIQKRLNRVIKNLEAQGVI